MNALDLEYTYHNLNVVLTDFKSTTVNVRRYQNNTKSLKENQHWGNKAALVKKDQLVGRMSTEATRMETRHRALAAGKTTNIPVTESERDIGLLMGGALSHLSVPEMLRRYQPSMMQVHSGKGSPEEIQICLHLIALYGLYDKRTFGNNVEAGIRDYCDRYIGLDCNGFVGNYGQRQRKGVVPNTQISAYATPKKRLTRLEDVQPDDVLVWPDYGHIAIIGSIDPISTGSNGKPARHCAVVESTASNPSNGAGTSNGGLQNSIYSIRSVAANQLFNVERPRGSAVNQVYIARLGS